MSRFAIGIVVCLATLWLAQSASAQAGSAAPIHVKVSVNSDGSRTVYETDPVKHTAIATTTEPDGKVRSKIRYTLDETGRFTTGEVFGPKGQFRFKATYRYDNTGKLIEEIQAGKDGTISSKIVYVYDSLGKQTGYAVYDASGKLVSRSVAPGKSGKSPRKKKSR